MQVYKIGDIINYKVKSRFTNYCELIDEETDITSYLQGTAKLVLFKGQTEASNKKSKEFNEILKKMQETNGQLQKSMEKQLSEALAKGCSDIICRSLNIKMI